MKFLLFFSLFTFYSLVFAEELIGKVVAVVDGDTVKVLVTSESAQETYKIRLAEIDTPEKAQPWGNQSKQALSELVFGKIVRVDIETKDKYGRLVAHLYVDNFWVNGNMEWLHYIVQGLVKIVQVTRGVKWHKESMIRS